jgi:hypothetical protein
MEQLRVVTGLYRVSKRRKLDTQNRKTIMYNEKKQILSVGVNPNTPDEK